MHRPLLVHSISGHVEHAAHHGFANGHRNRFPGIRYLLATLQSFRRRHRNGTHPVVAQVLLDLERQLRGGSARRREFDEESIE
jgi:hypothetical protein